MSENNSFGEINDLGNLANLRKSLARSDCVALEFDCTDEDCKKDFIVLCDADWTPAHCPFCGISGIKG